MIEVDVKKIDYTIRDWDDTDELKDELRSSKQDKDHIIREIEEHGAGLRPVIHIFGRSSGGSRVHLRVHGVKPYFYMPIDVYRGCDIQNDNRVIDTEKGYSSIQGDHMVKVCARIPGDVGGANSLREDYAPDDHYEADILFPNRFLIDSGIEGGIKVPSHHATPSPTDIALSQIEKSEYDQKNRVCFCDIEVDDSDGFPDQEDAEREIISITVYDTYTSEYDIFIYHPDTPVLSHSEARVRLFDNEIAMLNAFNSYITRRDFDVITGWNFTDFDSRYLINRIDNISNDDNEISKRDISNLGSAYDDGWFGAKIKGMTVFDLLRGYKNLQFTDLDSYSLEDVAQEELGTGKVKDTRSVYELWNEDPQKLVDYNVKDVKLTVRLDEEQAIIKFYEEIANYVGGRLGEVIDASKAVDIKVLRAVNGEWAVPSSKNVETEEFEGAKVFDPIVGVKENVVVLDLASLYPMSMKTLNAGPETKDPNGDLVAPNGVRFSNDEDAVVVEIIDEMLEERQRYKNLRNKHPPDSKQYKNYDRKQAAVKVVMNCFSGDTEVLTPDGIRNIQDIEVGDVVYSINPDTGNIEVKPVTNSIEQENQYGKLEHISTNHTNLKITPNHRMVIDGENSIGIQHYDDLPRWVNHTIPNHNSVSGERVDTKNILPDVNGRLWISLSVHGNSFNSSCPWEIRKHLQHSKNRKAYMLEDIELWDEFKEHVGHMVEEVKVQYGPKHSSIPIEYDMDNWLKLLGWVISEGSFNSVASKESGAVSCRGGSDRVQIAQKQSKHRTDIVELVDEMELNYSTDSNGVYLYNSNIHDILVDEVGDSSYNKQIPDWVFENDMPGEQLKKLLFALIDGDGDVTGKDSFRYSTVSEQLKEDVMKLAVLCGYKVSANKDSGVWVVYINKNSGSFKKGKSTDNEPHNGLVYCIEVEDNHTLMAGRNGKFQWTGNTLYGVMGWDRFRLQDKEVGAAVTAVGREVIKFTEEVVDDMGFKVVYGDTDSVMVSLGYIDLSILEDQSVIPRILNHHGVESVEQYRSKYESAHGDVTDEKFKEHLAIVAYGLKIEDKINDRYNDFAKEELNADEHFFDIEFEKLYERFFQAGKKKRYAGLITWKEGKHVDKIDNVGFETNRSDYSKVAKDTISSVLEHILRDSDLDTVYEELTTVFTKLRNEEYDPDYWGIPASVSQSFDQYETETPAVKGSRYSNENFGEEIRPGDKPKMNYVKRIKPDDNGEIPYPMPDRDQSKTQPCCWMNYSYIPDNVVWDWDKYIESQIKSPLERILLGTDWTWSEAISGDRQPKLNEYESTGSLDSRDTNVITVEGKPVDVVDDPEEPDVDDIESNVSTSQAKNVISETNSVLDKWDGDSDSENPVSVNLGRSDDEPKGLDAWAGESDSSDEVVEVELKRTDEDDDEPKNLDDWM